MDKGKKHVDPSATLMVNDNGEGPSFALKNPSPMGREFQQNPVLKRDDTKVVMQATNLVIGQVHVLVVEQVNVPIIEQAVASAVDRVVAQMEATPLVAKCSENKFSLLPNTSFDEIASEPAYKGPM